VSAYSDLILSLSPVAYWRFGESSGSSAADASGNSRTGTYTGTYTLGATSLLDSDTADTAVSVAGAGYAYAAHDSAFNTSSAFTVIGTFKRSTTSGTQGVFHKGDFAVGGGQGVSVYTSGNDVGVEYFSSGWYGATASGVLPGTDTFSFAFVYAGGTSAKVAVNGTVTSVTLPVALPNTVA
jgi:hypothetical protein